MLARILNLLLLNFRLPVEKLVINDISPTAQTYHRLNSKALQLTSDEIWKNQVVVFIKLLGTVVE